MSTAERTAVSRPLDTAPPGVLTLQCCGDCGSVQYPPRERCRHCLADALAWRTVDGAATVLACTALHHSLEERFRARLPWHIASLQLDAGPVVFAHLEAADAVPGRRLQVVIARDGGAWCLVAVADSGAATLERTLRNLGMDP